MLIFFSLRLVFVLAFFHGILSLFVLEHTLDQHRSYRDCFIDPTLNDEFDDYLSYCLRIDDIFNESWSNTCYKGNPISFIQLQKAGVTANQLIEWNIPVDVSDIYGVFLLDNLYNDRIHFICNCSLSNTFGRYCEYAFEGDIDNITDLINSSIEEKKEFYPKDRLLSCYELENNLDRCLDYRDICDGEFDTINGIDEIYCYLIEINTCNNNEFRCRNGYCIDRQFLFDGQGDCTDFSDEQSLLIIKKYFNFEYCYQQSTFDCDEHWCGREMISCGDGECIPWFQRFWAEHDCHNYYTHIYNCELEERHNKSIDFSITDNHGRCKSNITEFDTTEDQCLLMIKCAVTLHPSCQSFDMPLNNYTDAINYVYDFCQNRTSMKYASGIKFFSPFVRADYISNQFKITVELEFFALMKIRIPGRFCLVGEYMCQGGKVIQNGSECFTHDEIYGHNYSYPPYEYLFCRSVNQDRDYCMNKTLFYRCRTTGECISKYRLFDGFRDCLDWSDEEDLNVLDSLESLFMKDRYNCTIDGRKSGAVMRHFLGDGIAHCKEGTDEMSRSINWQQQQCFKSDDYSCRLLRDLYNENKETETIQKIRFTSLCDSIWDLRNGSDEIDCHDWICESGWFQQHNNLTRWSGNCINPSWKCNQIWDYTDGSDEFNCNYTELYPIPNCLSLITGKIILLNESNTIAGNGHIDCSGGIDERVTWACNDGFPLNERFLCNDRMTCLEPMLLCNHINDCLNGEDENEYWCGLRPSSNSSICKGKEFACQERNDFGPCIPQEDRCHEERTSCLKTHLDDHMCIHPRKYNRTIHKKIPEIGMQQAQLNQIPPWYCDRGLVVKRFDKLACLCPPSFYGHRCEKHTHRITIIFTLDINTIKADLIRINVLLMNGNQTIDSILLTQTSSCRRKHRIYLNYPRSLYSDLRTISNNYNVQFRSYIIDNNTVKSSSISQYPIKYSFLPAFRLVVALQFNKTSLLNDQPIERNWSSLRRNGSCAFGSRPVIIENKEISCICATQQYGPTCHLTTNPCRSNYCQNQGTCISYVTKYYTSQFQCLCSNDHFGEYCEHKKAVLSLNFHNEIITSSIVRIVQLINHDMTKMELKIEQQYGMSKSSEQIFHNNFQLPSIGLLKVYEPRYLNIYLLYFNDHHYSNLTLTEENKTECKHAEELNLIPMNNSPDALLFTMKRYHQPCQQLNENNKNIICFYDLNTYFCFCNYSTQRSSCFLYNFKTDQCNQCLNGGQCIQGDTKKTSDIFCLCPPCYDGRLCELSTEPFGFTLDSLIVKDRFSIQMIYLCLAMFFFFIGLLTNTCSIVTFKRPTPRVFGVGNYLFVAAIVNQTSLFFLVVKILSIILGTKHIAHVFFCKSIAYFLSVTTRANYWLTTWITIERLVIIIFPTWTTLRDPKVAFLIMIMTFFGVFGMHFHDVMSYTVIEHSSLCIPIFRSSIITVYNQVTLIFHHLIPFIVQMIMITLLILLAARSRHRSFGRKTTFALALKKQFHIHKELYLTPAIIVLILSILPQGILSFSVACTELKHWQRYILLITYFLSYIPPMLGFILQVLPSSGYTTEFKESSIGKLRFFKWILAPKPQQKKEQNIIDRTIMPAEVKPPETEQSEQPRESTINFISPSL